MVVELVNGLGDCVDEEQLHDALGEAGVLVEGELCTSVVVGGGGVVRYDRRSSLRDTQLLSVVSELLALLVPLLLLDEADWDGGLEQILEGEHERVPLVG